MSEPVANQK